MPAMVFATGIFLGTEMFSWPYAGNMGIVTFGVAVASWGERVHSARVGRRA